MAFDIFPRECSRKSSRTLAFCDREVQRNFHKKYILEQITEDMNNRITRKNVHENRKSITRSYKITQIQLNMIVIAAYFLGLLK
jgi:hypothetical protein